VNRMGADGRDVVCVRVCACVFVCIHVYVFARIHAMVSSSLQALQRGSGAAVRCVCACVCVCVCGLLSSVEAVRAHANWCGVEARRGTRKPIVCWSRKGHIQTDQVLPNQVGRAQTKPAVERPCSSHRLGSLPEMHPCQLESS